MQPIIYLILAGIILFIAIPAALIFYARYWNGTKFLKAQMAKMPIDTFGGTISKWKDFTFSDSEDRYFARLQGEFFNKIFTPKGTMIFSIVSSFMTLLLPFLFILFTNGGHWIAWLVGLLLFPIPVVIFYRSSYKKYRNIEGQREGQIRRMFEVANSVLKFDPMAAFMPSSVVNVTKWKDQVIPQSVIILYPTNFRADTPTARENFESVFNTAITEDNAWIYTWHPTKNAIQCRPVEDLPKYVEYKGAGPFEWHTFPLGVGLGPKGQEIISYSVNKNKTGIYYPHVLVAGTTGAGKANSLETIVKTPYGTKVLGDLQVGDEVFDNDGNIVKVTHLHPIITPEKAYKVVFSDGEEIVTDPEHLWFTETRASRVSDSIQRRKKRDGLKKDIMLFDDAMVKKIEDEIAKSSNLDTISIPEVAAFVEKESTSQYFYKIASIVGVAEEVHPTYKQHYNAQKVVQKQLVTFVNANEFINIYNSYGFRRKSDTPLFKSEIDKIQNLVFEVRESDTITSESIIEYLGLNYDAKIAKKWIVENFNGDVKELAAKAKQIGKNLFPDRILQIGAKYINKYDFAAMVPNNETEAHVLFSNIAKKVQDRYVEKTEVELAVPEYTTERIGAPYFTYPKKMFLEQLLAHAELTINNQQHKRNMGSVKTTQEIKDTLFVYDGQGNPFKNHWIRQAKALKLPEAQLPIQPYSFGAWLGDGDVHAGNICGIDHEVFENVELDGYALKSESMLKTIKNTHKDFRDVIFPTIRAVLRSEGFLLKAGETVRKNGTTKHIPTIYLRGSIEQRRALLAGLMDTDGTVDPSGSLSFSTVIPELRDGVLELIRTLGYVPRVNERTSTNTVTGKRGKTAYTITFNAHPEDNIFHVSRKQKLHKARYKSNPENSRGDGRYIVDIVEVETVPMRCLSVDSADRLFLVGESMVATHNSVIQRNIIFHCIQHNDMWRFLGVDLKRVELSRFKRYTKTVLGIATDLEQGVEVVKYAHDVMMERYEKMEKAGVNIFLDMVDENGKPEYAILLMVDEAFMFMSPEGNKSEEGKRNDMLHAEASHILGNIARLGRAAGVHLVLATQRPDATVIKGELKNNLDVRIAAGRLDSTPSLMVLDSGAATLLPPIKGRGLVRLGADTRMFQGFFAEQDWIDNWLAKPQNRWREPDLFKDKETTSSIASDFEPIDLDDDFIDVEMDELEEFEELEPTDIDTLIDDDIFEEETVNQTRETTATIPLPPVAQPVTQPVNENHPVNNNPPIEPLPPVINDHNQVAEEDAYDEDEDFEFDADELEAEFERNFMFDDEIDEIQDADISEEEIERLLKELSMIESEEIDDEYFDEEKEELPQVHEMLDTDTFIDEDVEDEAMVPMPSIETQRVTPISPEKLEKIGTLVLDTDEEPLTIDKPVFHNGRPILETPLTNTSSDNQEVQKKADKPSPFAKTLPERPKAPEPLSNVLKKRPQIPTKKQDVPEE